MSALRSLYHYLLKFPVKLFVKCKVIPDNLADQKQIDPEQPIFYVIRYQSTSDVLALQSACKKLDLPNPLKKVIINGKSFPRVFFLEKTKSVLPWKAKAKTNAIEQGFNILTEHELDAELNAQMIPVNITWGRTPTKEKNTANVGTVIADEESPTWLRKIFIVLFTGRDTLARFSDPLHFRDVKEKHGDNEATAHKLIRIARFHFYRQTISVTGPRLMHRQQMFTAMFANPAIKKIIADEVKSKNISQAKVKKQALEIMDEIAGDYRESMISVGTRVLTWLWKRLYKKIEVSNANTVRNLAQEGHEIIYVPCHRSHMDYLLLTYIIAQEGLVTPRIAAGINLNFWPAGPIFRKAGAFFIRRSFNGNRLYSTIFREYLGLLFERGYSVKYYSEGGRSRTGRLLPAKTGMLAMTIQSLLRGIDRPLTLVPVYIGYEHVMEVGTYHKELSGSEKKKESFLGVFKAIKSLRNYGKGYINFGEPININKFLTDEVPDWKSAINPLDPQKPKWLTPTVNLLADKVMTNINQCAALNGVSLVALILHATDNKALSKSELESQLDFFLMLQRSAPYSTELTVPPESGTELLAEVIALNKVTVNEDSFGEIISLDESATLEMRYYRNNILHTYVLHAFVCRVLECNAKVSTSTIVKQVQILLQLIKSELFLWGSDDEMRTNIETTLSVLSELNIAQQNDDGNWSLMEDNNLRSKARILAECIDETIQRFAIICSLIYRLSPIDKASFEEKVVSIAKRLCVLNNISAPEFIDKKAQSMLISSMQKLGYIDRNEDSQLVPTESLKPLKDIVVNLTDIEVLQSIAR
ncbi:glycerol-3-phosphate 1-O-acyltransferase PlsB [Pseudocolwellia agarivorans]|uniref:glycerol-3-phosphate 1-O-acyltransferase PlsB n=1 Tax=Pseudocolwellia agarivorans TaxID=1911682 RepID=UPI00098535C7|nr:glycerol-3-phosphate 1-O-acyltransferase PlsB [Pseudocolwellia agarivorans]